MSVGDPARITFDYTAKSSTELSVSKGDEVILRAVDHDEWWEVEKDGTVGFVPKSFCKVGKKREKDRDKEKEKEKEKEKLGKVKAEFAYTAQSEAELSLVAGETIRLTSTEDAEWWSGTNSGGKSGFFPASFVSSVSGGTDEVARRKKGKRRTQARVLFAHTGESATELTVQVGWIVDVVAKPDSEWWECRHKGQVGFVPSAFLEELGESATKTAPPTNATPSTQPHPEAGGTTSSTDGESTVKRARVLFDFKKTRKTELTIRTGQIVNILEKSTDEWWEVSYDGIVGFVPASFCREMGSERERERGGRRGGG
jgi:hypothetical protein